MGGEGDHEEQGRNKLSRVEEVELLKGGEILVMEHDMVEAVFDSIRGEQFPARYNSYTYIRFVDGFWMSNICSYTSAKLPKAGSLSG